MDCSSAIGFHPVHFFQFFFRMHILLRSRKNKAAVSCCREGIFSFCSTCGPSRGCLTIEFFHNFMPHQLDLCRACPVHLQSFAWVRSIRCHQHSCSKENCGTSFFKLPWSVDFAKMLRDQHRCEPKFATITHVSRQFQIVHVPGLGLLNRKDGRRVRGGSNNFFLWWKWLILIEISCQTSTWRSWIGSENATLTSVWLWPLRRKRGSLNPVQIDWITSNLRFQPSLARPSPSGVFYAASAFATKKLIWYFLVDTVDFGFVSTHILFESFVKQRMSFCQGLLFGAYFHPCRHHLTMQPVWVPSWIHFYRFRAAKPSSVNWSHS